jgi:hypothetical protein
MTTTTTKTAPKTTDLPEIAQQVREQFVSTVKQGQQLTVDAVQAFTKAASVLPTPVLPEIPGVPALPGVVAVTTYTFDLAIELLNAQRDFALQLAGAFTPAKV